MATQLTGIALITGAASGIGRGTALAFARNGVSSLALLDISLQGLEATRTELEAQYPKVAVAVIQTDVTNEGSIAAAVKKTVESFGRIDIAVHAAGFGSSLRESLATDLSEWQRMIDVNQTGLWLCQCAIIRQMLTQESRGHREGRGVIVNVSSGFGVTTPPAYMPMGAYAASKHAVVGITRQDAKSYIKQGVRLNAICPGWVDTPMIGPMLDSPEYKPMFDGLAIGRVAQVEEMAEPIVFLASPMSSYMVGAAMVVDGGYTA